MQFDEFAAFEKDGWEHVVPSYEDYFGRLTVQAHPALLDALSVAPGIRMLDVAAGPGNLAAAAIERGATAAAVDFSASMIAHARQFHPEIEFHLAGAEQLPFGDESFDAVGINFGMLHFPEPERALDEAARVLRQGGRIAFTAWAAPERAVGFGMVLDAVRLHGTLDVGLPPSPPFFRFSDPDECVRVLTEAGFADARAVEVEQTWHLVLPETPLDALMHGGVRMAALLRAQSKSALAAIAQEVHARVTAYARHGELLVPMPCVLASATKP
ncbi:MULTISPECIES: methyltransferase domain-containing protein [Caballeronia]|jgi:SAM-dependent methyltransferase|uniref:Ubiquinone biosynthesis methyltransferase UbiE n=1 Tax=Caballeronia zhejiangensis TaxID=871203 RepID=A0A656QMV1_9BURK|nr:MULTISPECIES: methyltransferase domain-containing protein [Caballeronia]EKS66685.1 methyltransferase [Burkholderia sp. SJ98]KDR30947.1 ubiquinone biosynthesis methyltransferase UbiE [Caballeronia zhejiangensis]MDR5790037.1 methyltransferase domain-containing protein [Caballeronia sp. LP003]MDR5797355.1 methyltransferase domain-containing protein [Caballeronia sp. LZ008]